MKTSLRIATALPLAATFAASCWLLQYATSAQAAERTATAKPRIGLALSGGGARGLAHVGVLRVLEELRVPVDCITGTSMGAIVAGTYASGTPIAEMEKSVVSADWNDIFRDAPPRADMASRRKVDDYKTLFQPEYGVKDGSLALPKGVLAGVSIHAFFRKLTVRAIGISDFNKLPIPYRAIAGDIVTGEPVVLDHGNVALAMRASMSVPGALAPVEIDGHLLVDGGIANNLPIEETRKLCADVVIAVNISTPPLRREELTSALSVTTQLVNFLGKATVDEQLKTLGERDVLIAPELGNISASSFDRATDAIRAGEAAARSMTDALKRYSLPPDQYAALRSKQTVDHHTVGVVDEIRFEGLSRTNPAVLRELVQSKPGEPLAQETVNADLRRIYGRGDFESIDYRIEQGPAGRVMVITPREKEWGPDYLRFGLGLATDFQGENNFNVLVQYRRTWLNRLGGEWITEGQIGQNAYLSTQFIQPLKENGRLFVAPYARVGQSSRSVFIGENKVADYQTRDALVGLDAGLTLGVLGEARLGALWRNVHANVDTGSPVLPDFTDKTAGPRARFLIDQLDNPWFPRSGYRALGSMYMADTNFGSDRDYKRIEGQILGARSWGPHTLNLSLSGGSNLRTDMPAYETFTLGGPLQLSGYRIDEFSGREVAFGRAMYYNRAVNLPDLLGSGVYVGTSLEVGRINDRFDSRPNSTIWSGSVFLGAQTFAGPAYFGLGAGEAGRFSLYLLLGAP